MLRIATADLPSYAVLRDETLATLPGMRRLTSTIVMKRIVDNRTLPVRPPDDTPQKRARRRGKP